MDEIIKICNFIKNIELNQKPCFIDQSIISTNSMIGSLSRKYWHKENRYTNIEYLNKFMDDMDRIIENNQFNRERRILLKEAICGAIYGFENLIKTYHDDIYVKSKYEEYRDKFKNCCEKLDNECECLKYSERIRTLNKLKKYIEKE